jgi:hypothetical protein
MVSMGLCSKLAFVGFSKRKSGGEYNTEDEAESKNKMRIRDIVWRVDESPTAWDIA